MNKKITWPAILLVAVFLVISQILGSVSMFLLVKVAGIGTIGSFTLVQTRMVLQFAFLNFYYILSLLLLQKFLRFRLDIKKNLFTPRFGFGVWVAVVLVGVSYQFVGSEFENIIADYTGRNAESVRMIHEVAGMDGMSGFLLAAFFIGICPPVFEEIFFRHILQKGLTVRYGFNIAVLVTSVFFAAIHMNLSTMPPIFLLSLVLGTLYERYNLLAGIVLHAAVNLTVVFFVRWEPELAGNNLLMEHLGTGELLAASAVFAGMVAWLELRKKNS